MSDFKIRLVDGNESSMAEREAEVIKEAEIAIEDPIEEQIEIVEDVTPVAASNEINDDVVLSHIRTKYNKEVASLDDLFQASNEPEQLDAEVAAFRKYNKETGRGIDDFAKLSRDVDNVPTNKLLSEFYKDNGDDEEEVEYRLSKLSYDEDLDSDEEIADRKMALKQELKKAKQYFNEQKEKYNVPLESREPLIQEADREDYEAYRANKTSNTELQAEQQKKSQYFAEKTNELFTDKFEGFGFDIDGERVVYKPADVNALKEQSTLNNLISSFLDENGFLKDAEKFHRAMTIAADPDKFAKFFTDKGIAKATTGFEKDGKNIDMVRGGSTPAQKSSGITVKVVDTGQNNTFKIKKR